MLDWCQSERPVNFQSLFNVHPYVEQEAQYVAKSRLNSNKKKSWNTGIIQSVDDKKLSRAYKKHIGIMCDVIDSKTFLHFQFIFLSQSYKGFYKVVATCCHTKSIEYKIQFENIKWENTFFLRFESFISGICLG